MRTVPEAGRDRRYLPFGRTSDEHLFTCLAILVAGCPVGISIPLVRKFVPEHRRAAEERREPVFAFAGVLLRPGDRVSVPLHALDGYQTAETAAGTEADSVSSFPRGYFLMPRAGDRIGYELICYSRAAVDDESAMEHGRRSELATAATDRFFQSFGKLGTKTAPTTRPFLTSPERVSDLVKAWATRLLELTPSCPRCSGLHGGRRFHADPFATVLWS